MHVRRDLLWTLPVVAAAALAPTGAAAKSHLWRFTEFFSNADGSVQFVEMVECCGSSEETQFKGFPLTSNANTYVFPNNLVGDTAHRWVLIATQAFAELPGAPTPDFIVPEEFFDPAGDVLTYRTHDQVVIPANAMPVDGVHSVDRSMIVQVNDPINFAGETGSVDAGVGVPGLGAAALALLAAGLAAAGVARLRRGRLSRAP